MSLNEAFHFLFGGMAATQSIFEIGGNNSVVFSQSDASHLHIHGFVLSNPGGATSTVTFSDADGTDFYECVVPADDSVIYSGAPFHIDNGLTITVSGFGNVRWSVAYCGELVQR